MPTSGLVISLPADPNTASESIKAIDRLPDLAIGEPVDGRFLPATIQASDERTQQLMQTLESLPGVDQVSLTWIGLDADDTHCPIAPKQEVTT